MSLRNKPVTEQTVRAFQQSVWSQLAEYAGKPLWVAYSGGVDSHVLLHILAQSTLDIQAVHIDHGLHPHSQNWARHCADIAAGLAIPLVCLRVEVNEIDALGMEAAARKARYQALADYLPADALLLTAQHQHDQAETVLLQLLRGAGPQGLSAMATHSTMGTLNIVRPLLAFPQSTVLSYARYYQLNWIEDPSNADTRWNRNYLRHHIWPQIAARWPAAAQTLSRSAAHCAQAGELLADLAAMDLQQVYDESHAALSVDALLSLSAARQHNLLRYFIQRCDFPLPTSQQLEAVIREVCRAREDSTPVVRWGNVEARRFQGRLYLMRHQHRPDNARVWQIQSTQPLDLGAGHQLIWQRVAGSGLDEATIRQGLQIRFRQGGERIRLQGHAHHQRLKHLFQQWQIPPWQRQQIPLIFKDEALIAVAGYGVSEEAVTQGDTGFFPVMMPPSGQIFIEKNP